MLGPLTQRLLPLLQLTRMALVFTAIADGLCSLLLRSAAHVGPGGDIREALDPLAVAAMAAVSVGLYGFGMSLNDIIDRRRDRQIAADRPLPSGRIGIAAAHVICTGLGLLAILGGILFMMRMPEGRMSLLLIVFAGLLIAFYDFAGKYLVAPGLLTLGLIRFFHATIAAPQLPLLWHPLLLLNHVAILSAVAYYWEAKRPSLTRGHWWAVFGGLGVINALVIGLVWWRREARFPDEGLIQRFWIEPGLALPLIGVVLFLALAWRIRHRSRSRREAGGKLMLYGLLWLIVYDAAFVAGYVGLLAGGAVLLLLPVAWLSVQAMRWWSKLAGISQKPTFKRAES